MCPRAARTPRRFLRTLALCASAATPVLPGLAAGAGTGPAKPLTDLSLEDLMRIEVTTVSRRPQRLAETAAAVSVLTADDIRRSGATSIPDALRLVPGVEVARIDGSKWAISIRGFNNGYANKLLVLVDGRSVYSPLFSGTFWDGPDTLLEDVERIEIIRGPGAAIWGANAVNGVVNIITRNASDTRGALVSLTAGTTETRLGVRYGTNAGERTDVRVYALRVDRNDTVQQNSDANAGVIRIGRAGFRADHGADNGDRLTFQGEAYEGNSGGAPSALPSVGTLSSVPRSMDSHPSGYHLKGRWERTLSDGSAVTADLWLDRNRRTRAIGLTDEVQTWDAAVQHNVRFGERHHVIWGGGLRTYRYLVSDNPWIRADPARSGEELANLFAQDEVTLIPARLKLTIGLKLERSSLVGGLNPQPDARLLWNATERRSFWAAVSRANRLPSILERSGTAVAYFTPAAPPFVPLPVVGAVEGYRAVAPEKLNAYQIGYREQVTPHLSLDATAFVQRYRNLIQASGANVTCVPDALVPSYLYCATQWDSLASARASGFEAALDWRPAEGWRLTGSYAYLDLKAEHPTAPAGSLDPLPNRASRQHFSAQVFADLGERWSADAAIRYTDAIRGTPGVPEYWATDARLAWHPRKDLELSLIGRNLFDGRHPEFDSNPFFTPADQRRALLARLVWTR